jgi:hypothetical protein
MYRAFEEFRARFPHRALHQLQCEEAIGEALVECKDFSGYLVSHGQYCRHAWCGDRITNCHDVISTGLPEWCYEGNTPDESYQCLFTIYCWKGKYILYSDNCHSSEHLFGCIALKRSKHCILNVAYTQHEYERNARKLLHHMRETGEWGEFFPLNYSPFPYNESRAFDVFPLAKSSAQNLGLLWGEDRVFSSTGATTLPEGIDDVPESIVTAPLTCSGCCRQYKILKLELAFYRKLRLPIPRLCPHCRRTARFERFPSTGAVYQRQCVTCHTSIPSAFSPNRQEQVVCEACYLKGLEE